MLLILENEKQRDKQMALADNNPANLERWATSLNDDDLLGFIRGKVKTKKVIAAVEELIRRYNKNELFELPSDDLNDGTYW